MTKLVRLERLVMLIYDPALVTGFLLDIIKIQQNGSLENILTSDELYWPIELLCYDPRSSLEKLFSTFDHFCSLLKDRTMETEPLKIIFSLRLSRRIA